LLALFVVNVVLYVISRIFSHDENSDDKQIISSLKNIENKFDGNKQKQFSWSVNIWGKAAIAEYLWLHIIEGELTAVPNFMLQRGKIVFGKFSIQYETGPYLMISTANRSIRNLVIVLNGREEIKINKTKHWLDSLLYNKNFPQLKNLGVLLLGNEACDNAWLKQYLNSDILKFVYVVYDFLSENSKVVQWPLGVATYRKFPLIKKSEVDAHQQRMYTCNFLGTVYPNSSRAILQGILRKENIICYTKMRSDWTPKETKDSAALYRRVLKESDLTLCPVGINSESYRIYESISYGSVPVLEDIVTPGKCDFEKGPFRVLKKYKAPVIFVKDWNELKDIIIKEKTMTMRRKIKRRQALLDWYEVFRYKLREEFLKTISSTFTD